MRVTGICLLLAMALAVTSMPARSGEETGDLFIKNARQLTYDGRRSGEGYFSPDGRYYIFQSERDPANPFYQIFMLDLETGDVHRVSPGTGKTTCSYFRPGTDRVLYASTHLDPDAEKKQKEELERRAQGKERRYAWDYDETFDIFSANRDGSDIKRLTDARGYDAEGGYSPDGSRIVFSSMRDAYTGELSKKDQERLKIDPSYFAEIYIMDADGSNQKRLTDWPGYDGGPFFSPDGTRIIWRHFTEDGAIADVYTMKPDGSDRRRLTDFGSMCWAPYFHPSGKYVIFTTNKQGFSNFELYLVDAEGTKEPVRVTHTAGFDGLPVFSPDGKRLAWTSNRTPEKMSQLFMGEWDHEAALEALKKAPKRATGDDGALLGTTGREAVAGYDKAEFSPDISAADLRRIAAGLSGATPADYVAGYFESLGLEPLGDNDTYLQGGNVVAYLPAADAADVPAVVIGASEASGTAVMMELAGALVSSDRLGAGLVFATWSDGVPEGFTPGGWEDVSAYIGFGPVGHLRENTLLVQGAGSSQSWRGILERRNIPAGFNLMIDDSHSLPDDAGAFYASEVPVVAISTDGDVNDDAALDYEGMARIARLALAVARDVAGADEPLAWSEVTHGDGDGRESLRAYLGTIPDYAGGDGVTGVKLNGVNPGGPAEKAGLAAGDVIVEFGGVPIENIYDYSNAIDAVKIGEPVKVVVLRGGERVDVTVVPEARQ